MTLCVSEVDSMNESIHPVGGRVQIYLASLSAMLSTQDDSRIGFSVLIQLCNIHGASAMVDTEMS